ncbi:MAG: hypothetical protein KAJ86_05860 [Alphaproteobacteria bacterium]|nr:hypothetical protein [Alphaproteobacteria bacterium]
MVAEERRVKEEIEREKYRERWEAANVIMIDYSNFCIKMLVTLNSTAILASIAFIGSFSLNKNPVFEADIIAKSIPNSFLAWSASLSAILLSALFTYFCHRWYPTILYVAHKQDYIDIYEKLTFKEKMSYYAYNIFVWIGIISGIFSLLMFLCGIWNITISFV